MTFESLRRGDVFALPGEKHVYVKLGGRDALGVFCLTRDVKGLNISSDTEVVRLCNVSDFIAQVINAPD